jgi:hypothetical protein
VFVDLPRKFNCFINGKQGALINALNIGGNFFVELEDNKILSRRDIAEIKVGRNVSHYYCIAIHLLITPIANALP